MLRCGLAADLRVLLPASHPRDPHGGASHAMESIGMRKPQDGLQDCLRALQSEDVLEYGVAIDLEAEYGPNELPEGSAYAACAIEDAEGPDLHPCLQAQAMTQS